MKFCFPHNPSSGGPGSFQLRFHEALVSLGYTILPAGSWQKSDIIFVVGGTKRILWLIYHKLRGSMVVHRIDGLNTNYNIQIDGLFGSALKVLRNLNVIVIANFFADKIVFQSQYIEDYWHGLIRFRKVQEKTILNGVNLQNFNPINFSCNKSGEIICVEGSINSLYAVSILNSIKNHSVTVVGKVPAYLKKLITNQNISFLGKIPRSEIPRILNEHALYLCLEVCPPCPNSVIEALAMNVPVIGFNSGSLKELVGNSGVITELKLDKTTSCPDSESLYNLNKDLELLMLNLEQYSNLPRTRAIQNFDIADVVDQYLKFIIGD